MPVTVEIRRGSARFVERGEGRATQHAFSFGPRYDPALLAFGPMVCHDDHVLRAGAGFEAHRHTGLDIVSWVVSGALLHTDTTGATHRVEAGSVAHLSAGAGVEHSEVAGEAMTRFVQVWLTAGEQAPDEPSYDVRAVPPSELAGPDPVTLVALPGATLTVARPDAGEVVTLPAAARVHAYLTSGALTRSSLAEPMSAGDAFLLTDEPAHEVTAAVPSELLVWSFTG